LICPGVPGKRAAGNCFGFFIAGCPTLFLGGGNARTRNPPQYELQQPA
jgi:hypothetical protein